MAAFRAIVNKRFPDDEDSCMSCLTTTKYCCLRCKFPLCNKCSIPEENEETPGWKPGKSVAYCEPCSNDVGRNNGGKPKPNTTQGRSVSPHIATPRNSDVEESSEEESDAVSTASKSVKPKTGRRSQWTVDQLDDFIDIVINNENFNEKLIFQNTKFQRNSSIYEQILKKLKARCAERNEEFNFSVNQLRSKFKKLVGECKKVALTVKTASGIENFTRGRGYGASFNNLYSLVKTRDSCNPDKAVEPSASLTAKGSDDESEVLDVNTEGSSSGEKEQKKFVPVRKNRKRKQTDDNCTHSEVFQLMRGMIENDPTRDLIAMMREDMERSRQHELRLMQVFMGASSTLLGSPYAATMYPGYFPEEFPSLQGRQFHPVAPSTVSQQSTATQSQARGSSPSTDSFISDGSVYLPL